MSEKLIQIRVSGSAADKIEHIKEVSGDSTKQLILNALATYGTLKDLPPGAEVVIEMPDGSKKSLILP